MTAETAKFIRTCETLHQFSPEKPLPEVFAKAQELMGLTSRQRQRGPRRRKAENGDEQQG